MLQSELPKRVILERLTHGLEVEKPPQFAIPAPKYTFETNLHGFRYDYQNQTVTISYKVARGLHDDMTVSFMTFRVILEGLAFVSECRSGSEIQRGLPPMRQPPFCGKRGKS